MEYASLSRARMQNATLDKANLSRATLSAAKLQVLRWAERTCPGQGCMVPGSMGRVFEVLTSAEPTLRTHT